MKTLSIAFMAAVSLLSVAGCKKKGGDDAAAASAKMTEFKDKMCKCSDKACADKVNQEMTDWSSKQKPADPNAKVSEEDMKKMAAIGEEMGKCMQKAMGMGGDPAAAPVDPAAGSAAAPADPAAGSAAAPADPAAAPAAAAGDLPAECNDYKAMIDKLASCDKMPQASRDAMKQAFDQASAAWANVPAEGRAALATGCKSAADAMKQSAASVCGW